MKDQKLSVILSIIALLISIVALVICLLIWKNCPCCHKHVQEAAPAVEQVEPQAAAPVEPVAAPQQPVAQEEPAGTLANLDGTVKRKAPTAPFIDLGLPSGTKWRTINEDQLMTFDEAVDKFGKQLPSLKQYTELYEKCQWKEIKEGGYKVIGPNGNYVIFPLTGFINCTGEFRGANEFGDYWTSTKKAEGECWRVVFNAKGVKIVSHTSCYARAIRLVE